MPAEIINLNDTLPAAPSGHINGQWQKGPQSGVDPGTGYPVFPVSVYVPLGAGGTVASEVPVGTQDGVNCVFTVSNPPGLVTLNGVTQNPDARITIAGLTITFQTAPRSYHKIRSFYTA